MEKNLWFIPRMHQIYYEYIGIMMRIFTIWLNCAGSFSSVVGSDVRSMIGKTGGYFFPMSITTGR